jgi:hypothetical protein
VNADLASANTPRAPSLGTCRDEVGTLASAGSVVPGSRIGEYPDTCAASEGDRRRPLGRAPSSRRRFREIATIEGFKQQAAEIIGLARERDAKTLRYDWFLGGDQTECEVREVYESSAGLIEHDMHVGEALDRLFGEVAYGHAVRIYGDQG